MKLAFYYHLEAAVCGDKIFIHSPLGVFLEDLATRVEKLFFIAHTTDYSPSIQDYCLTGKNIELYNLGQKRNFPMRFFFGCNRLKDAVRDIECDVLIVRAPTPLGAKLYKAFRGKCPIIFLLVGDYSAIPQKSLSATGILDSMYEFQMNHFVLPHCDVLVNSKSLYNKYIEIAKSTSEVKTTTITSNDFYLRQNTCVGEEINLLYVGRYDWQKGISELLDAVAFIKNKSTIKVKLHLVGWDDTPTQDVVKGIKEKIIISGISDIVCIEGKKSIGKELNTMYRNADIFVLPSYAEGMPRCIWEAMANGLPVIATKVGGIPYNIVDNQDAILIPPHSTESIIKAVMEIVNNGTLRKRIISNGYEKAKDATLEKNNIRIVELIKRIAHVE